MLYPLVRELAVDGIPVTVTCRVLDLARQPYYRFLADPVTTAELAGVPGQRAVRHRIFLWVSLSQASLTFAWWPLLSSATR